MPHEPTSAVYVAMAATMFLSLMVLYGLWQKHASGRPLLAYEPRKRVPWGPMAGLLVLTVPLLLVTLSLTLINSHDTSIEELEPADFIYAGWLQSIVNLSAVVLGAASLATFFGADRRDLGLPLGLRQAAKDCWLGLLACLASLLPIYVVQGVLTNALDSTQGHPLIEQLHDSFSPQLVVMAIVLTVVVAPVYEEFAFRLLFQGWLEKWEDKLVGYHPTCRQTLAAEDELEVSPAAIPAESSRPAGGMIAELPHGWTPVLANGLLFGLAHAGQGVAPVALTLFGIVLGYVYQRTHRLLPCIVAHMVFNASSMLLLGLQLQGSPAS
ncbi:MAG: CPBP family intramembrane metalloprotease [Pirellulales bacterium]|nr:CPBP family intramembrane metalloprotease [Pirellulales bacterium]